MDVFEQVFKNLDESSGPANSEDLARCENTIGRLLPADLKQFLSTYGWGWGFSSDAENSEYLVLFSPSEISESQTKELPEHLTVVGSNGGGEWIVVNNEAGYGLLPTISDYQNDYHHVASSFEEFLLSSTLGLWFQV